MWKFYGLCWQNEFPFLIGPSVCITIQTYNEFRNSVIFGYFLSFKSKCDYRPLASKTSFCMYILHKVVNLSCSKDFWEANGLCDKNVAFCFQHCTIFASDVSICVMWRHIWRHFVPWRHFLKRWLNAVNVEEQLRNECLFSGFVGNDSERGTNKSREPRSGSRMIGLFRAQSHSPWTQKKRHSFHIFTMFSTRILPKILG